MDICFAPSLQHLACAKIVTLLLNNPEIDLQWDTGEETHYRNTLKLKEILSKVLPCTRLKAKLESFISPILCEVENWAEYCVYSWATVPKFPLLLKDTVQQCWLSDGSIDREKSAKIMVKGSDITPINRFVFACIFCLFDDVLNLWNILSKIEKAYLRHTYCTRINNSDFIVKQWIEWFDTSTYQDWESFSAWTFQKALWKNNVYIMKRVFQTSSPVIRSHYLLQALQESEVSDDVKCFGLMIMSREEREVILRESPLEVFECILSGPLRHVFIELTDNLWHYINTETFCSILETILSMITYEERDYMNLLVILKSFWAQSPSHCKKAAEKDSDISRPLNFVLKYDFARKFSKRRFLKL